MSWTYNRDSFTGLDYADQRFYAASYGRFNTPDPYKASGSAGDPNSWNRYAYVAGDPTNHTDRRGLYIDDLPAAADDCGPDWEIDASLVGPCGGVSRGGDGSTTDSGTDSSGGSGNGESTGNSFAPKTAAKAALAKPKCAELLGFAGVGAAEAWLENGITFLDRNLGYLTLTNGVPQTKPAPAETSGFGTIYVNRDYNWSDFSKVTTSKGGTFKYLADYNKNIPGANLSSDQLATVIIIHELEHNRPGFGWIDNPALTGKNQLDIIKDCIR
jgi:RHS repeat-associated protein